MGLGRLGLSTHSLMLDPPLIVVLFSPVFCTTREVFGSSSFRNQNLTRKFSAKHNAQISRSVGRRHRMEVTFGSMPGEVQLASQEEYSYVSQLTILYQSWHASTSSPTISRGHAVRTWMGTSDLHPCVNVSWLSWSSFQRELKGHVWLSADLVMHITRSNNECCLANACYTPPNTHA
jgi:hypothetical protein